HGDTEAGAPGRKHGVGEGAEGGADHDRRGRLPHVEAEKDDGDRPDEDGGELQVRRKPGPEEVDRFAVAFGERDVLDTTRLDLCHRFPVFALTNRDFDRFGYSHASTPANESRLT